jgi:hypothetical protein
MKKISQKRRKTYSEADVVGELYFQIRDYLGIIPMLEFKLPNKLGVVDMAIPYHETRDAILLIEVKNNKEYREPEVFYKGKTSSGEYGGSQIYKYCLSGLYVMKVYHMDSIPLAVQMLEENLPSLNNRFEELEREEENPKKEIFDKHEHSECSDSPGLKY